MSLFNRIARMSLPALVLFASVAGAQSIDRAKQLFEEAKYTEAKTELRELQKANSRNAAAAYYLGRIATIENDGDEALRQLERAVELEEGNALYHYWLGSAARDAAPRASKMKMPFMARRMRKEFERAVELDPNLIDARYGLVQFYAMAPSMMGGGIDKAREQAAELEKRSTLRGAMARAMIAEQEKNAGAEEAAYQAAVTAAPDSAVAYFVLADMYARVGKPDEAFATIDRYVKRKPDDRWALYRVGRVAGVTGTQLDRGETALTKFLASPPSDANVIMMAGAHYWLGQIAEKRGLNAAARPHYETALKINPKSQTARRALDALK